MIDKFYGNYLWLSNFSVCRIEYGGYVYKSVQSAYKAQKFEGTLLQKDRIKKIYTKIQANQAKVLGTILPARSDWEEVRIDIMKELLRIKFNQFPFKEQLLETGDEELIQGNYWHDITFGKCYCQEHKGEGQNILGKLIMQIREQLKQEKTNESL